MKIDTDIVELSKIKDVGKNIPNIDCHLQVHLKVESLHADGECAVQEHVVNGGQAEDVEEGQESNYALSWLLVECRVEHAVNQFLGVTAQIIKSVALLNRHLINMGHDDTIVMRHHDTFGHARRARRVRQEAHVVARVDRRLQIK